MEHRRVSISSEEQSAAPSVCCRRMERVRGILAGDDLVLVGRCLARFTTVGELAEGLLVFVPPAMKFTGLAVLADAALDALAPV